jgi:hypothetical protein
VRAAGNLSAQDRELVAQNGDLHVFGVWRWAQTDQSEDLPDDHESQRTHHHRHIMAGRV